MADADNVKVVREFLTALRVEDPDRLRATLADDMVWWIPRSSGKMLGLPYPVRGADQVLAVVRQLLEGSTYKSHPGKSMDEKAMIAQGDLVMAFVNLKTFTAAGDPYENDYIYLSRVANGKIAEQWEFTDTADVFQRLGVSGS